MKIGIVGGMGWRSTVDYYSEICLRWEKLQSKVDMPGSLEICIESLDLRKAVSLLGNDGDEMSWVAFDQYHRNAMGRLQASGAEIVAMASNSPHERFDSITRGTGVSVVNLFDAVTEEAARAGASEVLILGTALTMRSTKLREAFVKRGIRASGPASREAANQRSSWLPDSIAGKWPTQLIS